MKESWPPQYSKVFECRKIRNDGIVIDPGLARDSIFYYSDPKHCQDFINDWCITYDPRNSTNGTPAMMPFILFKRQREFVNFIMDCMNRAEDGLVEKSRDMGATWLCCAISVWLWRFKQGASVGWGSRKELLVDRIGDPDSIFEKMRMIIDYLPRWLWPKSFIPKQHLSYMKIINPDGGQTITGEAGDNIGRGGRKTLYFKDESARYEHPESIEAALGDNTNCQIDISTVYGTNTVFHRRRKAGEIWKNEKSKIASGVTRIFIMDWKQHPLKTRAWYEKRRKKADREGLVALFAQEVDRDSASAVEGVLIPPVWVNAAVDAHKKLKKLKWTEGIVFGGLDVADEGRDKNSLCIRQGSIPKYLSEWSRGDTGQTANKAVSISKIRKVSELNYDCIGVGAGVKSETNRLKKEGIINGNLKIIPWNAAKSPLFPKGHVVRGDRATPKNADFFSNLKAQAWWQLRARFEKTFKAITQGVKYPVEELISLPATLGQVLHMLIDELSQPTYGQNNAGKIVINKKPEGSKSPNLADCVVMAFWPVRMQKVLI
jgi:hypothetical protein